VRLVLIMLAVATARANAAPGAWEIPEPGAVTARLSVETDLGKHSTFEPLSVAPDLVVGLDGRWAATLQHSRASHAELGAGNGLCMVGPRETLGDMEATCRERDTGLGVGALVRAVPGLTARGGVIVRGTGTPLRLAAALGVVAVTQSGRWWTLAAPTFVSGLTGREAGNRDRVQVPVYAGLTLASGELYLRSGIDGTLQTFHDTFAVPFGVGGSIVIRGVRIGAEAKLDKALGPLNATAWRSAALYVETTMGRP